jgi:hypothetical protein
MGKCSRLAECCGVTFGQIRSSGAAVTKSKKGVAVGKMHHKFFFAFIYHLYSLKSYSLKSPYRSYSFAEILKLGACLLRPTGKVAALDTADC